MTATALIEPISAQLQQQVTARTAELIQTAAEYFQQAFPAIPVLYDLRGKAAGMYRIKAGQRVIRYNPYIFARYFADNLQHTTAHEVAHYVTDMLYGLCQIRPHGSEWKSVMALFGVPAERTASYDLQGLPQRQYQMFLYRCGCRQYELTSRRHNKVLRGQGHYSCRDCGDKLLFVKKQD